MEVMTARNSQQGCRRLAVAGAGSRVCFYWLQGRCTRNPCRFLHSESKTSSQPQNGLRHHNQQKHQHPIHGGEVKKTSGSSLPRKASKENDDGLKRIQRDDRPSSSRGGGRSEQQSSSSQGFGLLAKLEGHTKAIAGIGLPNGSDKLYTASKDGELRIWDCHTGQCCDTVSMGGEVGSLTCEGSWLFVGLQNGIKACNIQNGSTFSLEVSSGLVYSTVVDKDLIFAGCENGDILFWRGTSATSPPELVATLKGHTCTAVSLFIGADRLYSGSADHTIRVWDIHTFECITTLKGHTDVVMSVLCWDQFLLSRSLDRTIKIWAAKSAGGRDMEVVYTHNEDQRILGLKGMHDPEGKPILLCSCNDDTVHLYKLPSFADRGKLCSRSQVLAMQLAPEGGLFFTGDGVGMLNVWKWSEEQKQNKQ